jgi:thiamine biosynthesis lipoprotein
VDDNEATRYLHVEQVMGTVVSVDIRDRRPAEAAVRRLVRWLHDVDAMFSTYRPDSQVSQINDGTLWFEDADPRVIDVLARCNELRRQTGGYFNARARGLVDPSALVKGWSVQKAADDLISAGFENFCLTAGGDVATSGTPEPDRPWKIGIQHPRQRDAIAAVVEVPGHRLAVATSGTYERGHHITNPHTGWPPSGVLSVTVCGPDLGTADAYSTAAFAMGTAGPDWTTHLVGYEAMTILADDVVLSTPGFPRAAVDAGR